MLRERICEASQNFGNLQRTMLRFGAHVWILWLLCAGDLTEADLSGCEQPCQNGGVCESHSGGFRCLCSQQSLNGRLYGGETCTTALSGCDGNRCDNGGVCSPSLSNGQHTYTCACVAGFTGARCQTPTVFSFESRGHMYIETGLLDPEAPLNVTFSFRTARPVGTLLQRRVDDLLLSIELMDGQLSLRSQKGHGSSTLVQQLPKQLSNSRWHTVEASLGGVVSLIRMLCTEGNCHRDSGADVPLLRQAAALPEPGAARQSLFLGAAAPGSDSARADGDAERRAFLGCFRDVFVDSQLVLPVAAAAKSEAQVNVTVGCNDRDKCAEGPCQNRGRCVSQGWRSYVCECHRPHEGSNCAEEYITARFGDRDLASYASFSLDDRPGHAVTVSMFVRTRQPGGLLLTLANSTSQYLHVWLDEGRLKVQVNGFHALTGRAAVNDGHFQLLTVKLDATEASLLQSSQSQGSAHIPPVQAHPGDLVFVGGLPDPKAAALFGGHFKGCVQDLRLNGKRLQFFPIAAPVESYALETLANVTRGCSSDNACAVNPCLNSGVCFSVWDDFICSCPPSTAGRRCEDVKWCELSPCPTSATCKPRSHGFECVSNVTFSAGSSLLHYRSNGRIKHRLSSVSLSVRTRQAAATLLDARKDSEWLTVSLRDSRLVVELQTRVDRDVRRLTLQSGGPVSDGEWHRVEVRMESHTLPASRWTMALDGDEEAGSFSTTSAGDLDFLKEGADILLGGRDPGATLSGCLGPVEIGGLLLPFHHDTELNFPRPQQELFSRVNSGSAPRYGCWGASVCSPDPCHNGGSCEDLFDRHRCACTAEWTGPTCQQPADACFSAPCVFGNCSSGWGGGAGFPSSWFRCECEPGYGGEHCETEVDPCEDSKCIHGATCLKGLQGYSCLCPQNLTGQYCDEKVPEIPWYIEINPLPHFPVSTCMGTRWNYSCFHGGNCSEEDNGCKCLPGFTGQWCEKDVDECASEPCMNGGFCLNYVNRFECVCDLNYSGIYCQMDVSDFYIYVFLGLWQNLFQLVSYLVIRFDDEPEIEWAFPVND